MMRFSHKNWIYSYLLAVAGGVSTWACSGRVVVNESMNSKNGMNKGIGADALGSTADVVVKPGTTDAQGLSLLSSLPRETMLNSFITQVEAPNASGYRFVLLDGENVACRNWGDFRQTKEPLKVDLGSDGAKTLCVQHKDKSGSLGTPLVIPFRKRSAREDGPEYTLYGKPSAYTTLQTAKVLVNSGDAVQYRYSFVSSAKCGTLESEAWRSIDLPIENLNFRYDGAWSLCLEIRDKFGNKNKIPHTHTWIRDTVYPVMDELPLPGGVTQLDELTFNIKGSQVFEYQSALIDGVSNCIDANYSAFKSANIPVIISLKTSPTKTLCVITRSEGGLTQQAPYVKVLRKISVKAEVKVQPVAVNQSSPGVVSFADGSRKFKITGADVTHYKAIAFDRSDNCDGQMPPSSPPVTTATTLDLTFSTGGIKTLCVWGYSIAAGGSGVAQEVPTYIRFYNDTNNWTAVKDTAAKPLPEQEASLVCGKCHDSMRTVEGMQSNAIRMATRLRDKNHSRPMPVGGWSSDQQRSGMLLYLYNIPGYPQDLPHSSP